MIKCPGCGNTSEFTEVLNGCCLEVTYKKKIKGWSKKESEVNPEVEYELIFECAKCGHDCTDLHEEFLDEYL